jgi:hypothetical protein
VLCYALQHYPVFSILYPCGCAGAASCVTARDVSVAERMVVASQLIRCNSAGSSWGRMFWKVAGYSQPSPLEAILDMDGFSLEDVLDESDLIQECKSLNGRLVNFLKAPSTVRSLLSYLVELPGPGLNSVTDTLFNIFNHSSQMVKVMHLP